MSPEETARTSCGCDGKRCSIFLDCPNPGSLVEKKKFSSATGLRSTRAATSPNKTTVTASIHQCAPERSGIFETNVLSFIAGRSQNWRVALKNLYRTFRQGPQEAAAVRLGHDPIIENDDDTVGFLRHHTTSFPDGLWFAVRKVFTRSPSPQTIIAENRLNHFRLALQVQCRATPRTTQVDPWKSRATACDQADGTTKAAVAKGIGRSLSRSTASCLAALPPTQSFPEALCSCFAAGRRIRER